MMGSHLFWEAVVYFEHPLQSLGGILFLTYTLPNFDLIRDINVTVLCPRISLVK